jgi:hypothetical protein
LECFSVITQHFSPSKSTISCVFFHPQKANPEKEIGVGCHPGAVKITALFAAKSR